MARIRSFHYDLRTDVKLARCSFAARWLYQAMKCEMDDYGVGRDDPERLGLQCLPADDVDVPTLIAELVQAGKLARYRDANGALYLHAVDWDVEEKVDRPSQKRVAKLEDLEPVEPDEPARALATTREPARALATTRARARAQERSGAERSGREWKGMERSGAERNGAERVAETAGASAAAAADPPTDRAVEPVAAPAPAPANGHANGAAPPAPPAPLSWISLEAETAISHFVAEFYGPYPEKRRQDVVQQLRETRNPAPDAKGAKIRKGVYVRAHDDAHLIRCLQAVIAEPPRDQDMAVVIALQKLGDPLPGPSPAEQRVRQEAADRELEEEYQRERRRAGVQWAGEHPDDYAEERRKVEARFAGVPGSGVRKKAIDVELAQMCGDRAGFPSFDEWAHAAHATSATAEVSPCAT